MGFERLSRCFSLLFRALVSSWFRSWIFFSNVPPFLVFPTIYVRGATPLSTQPVVLSIFAGYLATVFGIREIMKTHQPQKLTFLSKVMHRSVTRALPAHQC
jgi:hypothetical protein